MPAFRHQYRRYRQSNSSMIRTTALRALSQTNLRSPILHLFHDSTGARHHPQTLYGLQDIRGYMTDLTTMITDLASSIEAETNHLVEQEHRRMHDLEYFRRITTWAQQHQAQNRDVFPPEAKQCWTCKQTGHINLDCDQYICYNCNTAAPGHRQRDCPTLRNMTITENIPNGPHEIPPPDVISASESSLSSDRSAHPVIPPPPRQPRIMVEELRQMVDEMFEAHTHIIRSHHDQTGRPSWAPRRSRERDAIQVQNEPIPQDNTQTDSQGEQTDTNSNHSSRNKVWPGTEESELVYPTEAMNLETVHPGLRPDVY